MKRRKSIWTRNLSEFPIVRFAGTLAIVAALIYFLWGAFTGHLALGRYSGMHYYGTQARLLGFFLFCSFGLLLLTTVISERLNPKISRAISILAILSFGILIVLFINDFFEII